MEHNIEALTQLRRVVNDAPEDLHPDDCFCVICLPHPKPEEPAE